MSDNWDCYLQGVGTVAPSNADVGMMKRLDKLRAVADAYQTLTEKQAALCERMDRLQRRRDAFESSQKPGTGGAGGDIAAEPLAAVS
jgi:hypothetical protein